MRDIPSEVLLTEAHGLPAACAANFDNLQIVAKRRVGERIAQLSPRRMREATQALAFALALDE